MTTGIQRAWKTGLGSMDRVYKRKMSEEELRQAQNFSSKKVAENVYLVKYLHVDYEMLAHKCERNTWYKEMTFRENDEGPMYWCEGCGFVLDSGVAMAIRLYEAPIS